MPDATPKGIFHAAYLPQGKANDARHFFEAIGPKVLEARAEACRKLGGRIAFVIDGAGAWTIDFGGARIEPMADEADAALSMSSVDFESLLGGRLDVATALATKQIRFTGDPTALGRLAVVFDT